MKPEDGPWVSLPSKQYPNEVYYFNVSTGESSWEVPQRFCEPVDESTNFQSLARPTTPERTEKCYIVESYSPSSSPKKPQNVSKSALEVQKKGEREKRNKVVLQRNRSQIKEHISSKCLDIKRKLAKEENEIKSKSDRYLKNDSFRAVSKLSKAIMKEDIIQKIKVEERLQNFEKKIYDSYEAGRSSHSRPFSDKVTLGKMYEQYKCKDFENPNSVKERNEIMFRRCKFDVPIVCGAASLRMEQLKKQLREDRLKNSQRPQSDWPEYSSEKEWQTNLLKQKSRLIEEISHSNIPSYSSSPNFRQSYFSDLGKEPLRSGHVANFPSRSYSQNFSESLPKPYFSEEYGKPPFIKDYCHSRDYNNNMFPTRKYSESAPRSVVVDPIKLPSSFLEKKAFSKFTPGGSYSFPNFDKRVVSNPYSQSGSSQISSSYPLKSYYASVNEYKGTVIDKKKYYLPESERNFYPKPEVSSLMRTKSAIQLGKYNQVVPYQPPTNSGLVKDRSYSLEPGRRSLPDTYISKTSAMDRLRRYKLLLLQANALRNQHPADSCHSYKFNSNIGPFASSEAFSSGRNCNIESSKNIRADNAYAINQRKPIANVKFKIPSNYSTPLRNVDKGVETDCKRNEVVLSSWEWGSQGFVRDYNHKSITDSIRQNADVADNRVTHEKHVALCKLKTGSASEERQIRERISTPDESVTSNLTSKSSRYCRPSPYQENSARNVEKLLLPRKTTQLACSVKKNFGRSESEHVSRVKDNTSTQISSDVDYNSSSSSTNTIEQNKNSHNSSKFLQKVFKQKSQDSKGGITKINRRVQKQLRTAAPKLIHLPPACVNTVLKSPPQQKKMEQNCKPLNAVKYIEEEEMDWEPIEPEKVVLQVEALRKEGGFQNNVNPELENLCNIDTEVSSQWFVVLDTNVLLSHLSFLLGLRDMKDVELGMPTLFIPWVVLQELDHLKSTNKKVALENYARRAINFIYDNLLNKHPRVGGQPKAEADECDTLEPDDSILQCSLNLQKRSSKVLLLTNDRNLFNKAVVNRVECCSAPKLMQELENRRKSSTTSTSTVSVLDDNKHPLLSIIQTVKQCVGVVLEELLRTEMVLVYDRQWSDIVARKPPWTLNDILFCLLKHWVAVFRLVLPSAARELIEKIRTFVNNEVYETSLESIESIVKTCISLMHLISSLSYKQYVDNALKTFHELQRTLKAQTKLSTSNYATSSFAGTGKAGKIPKILNNTPATDDLDAASVISEGERHTQNLGTGIDSRENYDRSSSSSIDGSKVESDDCLSLFASSFSEDAGNNQLSDGCVERGQELTHKYLNKIWEKIAVYCGMLCNVMGVEPCVPYQPPEPFPAVETLHQNMLSFVKCVSTLLRSMEGILFSKPKELQENSPVLLNFYTSIKESLPTWNELGEALLPQHVLVYCTQTDTRLQLEHGKKQFEQFEAVLNRAVTFFMGQNQSSTSLPSF